MFDTESLILINYSAMLFTKRYFILTVFTLMMLLCCTQQQHNKNEVEMAMKQYDHLIQKMDMDSIALFYA
ncbi:MAG TPA: hypothetical protein VKI61_18890, partial [Chitinophagaceae bacterium]|nr:hypothetical protein [Chitinophagaceae bacterium]